MMQREFEERTNIFVTPDLYKAIEACYMGTDMDKDVFCKAYKENRDSMAERLRDRVSSENFAKESKRKEEKEAAEKEAAGLRKKISCLESLLEREQEWKPYKNKSLYDGYFDMMANMGEGCAISNEKAALFVSKEFGFNLDKVSVLAEIPQQEINRHGTIRVSKLLPALDRKPLYSATDWNYILFEVCGLTYECVNGDLHIVSL